MTHSLLCFLSQSVWLFFFFFTALPLQLSHCWMKEKTGLTPVFAACLFWQWASSSLSTSSFCVSPLYLPRCLSQVYTLLLHCFVALDNFSVYCYFLRYVIMAHWCQWINEHVVAFQFLSPPSGSIWQAENTISLIIGITQSSFPLIPDQNRLYSYVLVTAVWPFSSTDN